ncbi:macro domain-containing protein [Mycolicibacterium fortuitum]|uniref:macro domain-containing protein n=1 Tax=Mycolicibacterium fortuitum TaxID=1766 RepID=UPI00399BFE1B
MEPGDRALLTSCYRRVLEVVDELGVLTVAFPLISSGVCGWPRQDAIAAAVDTLAGTATGVEVARIVAFDVAMYDEVREQLSTMH